MCTYKIYEDDMREMRMKKMLGGLNFNENIWILLLPWNYNVGRALPQ